MKIQVNGEELNRVFKKLKPVIDVRKFKHLPILHSVKIIAKNDKINLIATDLDNAIIANIYGTVIEEGEICINAKDFQNLIKGHKTNITITDITIENAMVQKFNSLSTSEYPALPEIKAEKGFIFTNEFIKNMELCLPYVSLEDSRPAFNSVCIDQENFVATDGFKLITVKNNIFEFEKPVMFPHSTVKHMINIFKKQNKITLKLNRSHIVISDDVFTLISRINTSLKFVSYKQLIPNSLINEITVNNKYLKGIVNNIKDDMFTLNIGKIITCKSDTIEEFELNCTATGEDLEIILSKNHFLTLINSYGDDNITIGFTGRFTPLVISKNDITVITVGVRKTGNAA